MNTEKNLFIAVALSVLVYGLWFFFLEKKYMPPMPSKMAISQVRQTPSATPGNISNLNSPSTLPIKNYPSMSADFGKAKLKIEPAGAGIVSWQYQEPLGMVELVQDPTPGFFAAFPNLKFIQDSKAPNLTFTARRKDGLEVTKEFIPGVEGELRLEIFPGVAEGVCRT